MAVGPDAGSRDLRARGAASVKLVTLLDRQSARRVPLQPDYFGFLVDETFLVGYGLGAVEQTSRTCRTWRPHPQDPQ